jgi:hypothetical protein
MSAARVVAASQETAPLVQDIVIATSAGKPMQAFSDKR